MGDLSTAVQEDRAGIGNGGAEGRDGDCAVFDDGYSPIEEGVDAEAKGLVRVDGVSNGVGGIAVAGDVVPSRLTGWVVGQFALVEDRFAVVAVP